MWYEIKTVDGNTLFIETDFDLEGTIESGIDHLILVKRQVIPIPISKEKMAFALLNKVSPLAEATDGQNHYLNMDNIISIAKVNENSRIWNHIKESTLNENAIVQPDKKLIL